MKKISTPAMFAKKSLIAFFAVLFCLMMKPQFGWSQAASATWSLRTSNTPAIAGNVTASTSGAAGTFGGGLANTGTVNTNYGTYANTWQTTNTAINPATNTQYFQYSVTPTIGNSLTITSLSLASYNNESSFPDLLTIYYSTDPTFATSTAVTTATSINSSGTNTNTFSISATANSGQTLYFRIYFYYTSSINIYFGARSLTLSGTTTAIPAPTITSLSGSPQCVGGNITINGTGLTGATAANVKIGGTAVSSITSNNGSTIVAVIGSGTTGTVSVTTSGGTATSTASFTVNPLPVAAGAITGTATVCQGQNGVAYSVSAITNATGYVWTLPTGATIATGSNTRSITVNYSTAATSGNITVYGTNTCGNGTVSANYAVTVNPLPVAAGAITGTATVCQGQNGVAYSVPAITNATGYVWTLPTGATIATGSNTRSITVNYSTAATSGNITVYGTNTCGNGTISANYAVTVNPLPVAAGAITGTATVCQGQNAVSYTIPAITNATGYVWALPAGATIATGANTNSITVNYSSAATSGNITVYGTNTCGNGTVSANYAVTVNPLPVAAGAITGTATVCQGQAGVVYSVGIIANAASYTWAYSGTGVTINGNSNSITLDFSTTATPGNLTVTGVNSCGNGTTSANYAVTVNQPPTITANPSPATQTVCATSNVSYTVTATGTGLTYQWYLGSNPVNNGGRISGATTSTLTITGVTMADAGDYTVVVSGTSPCSAATSAIVHLDVNQSITFTAQPLTPQTICPGTTYTIYAQATGTVATYQWYYNGNPYAAGTFDGVDKYTLTIPNVTAATAGSYRLLLDDGSGTGCSAANSNIAVLNINTNTTTTNPLATQTVCQNAASTSLSVTASGTGPFTYQWFSNTTNNNTTGTPISGQTGSTFTPPTTTAATTYYYAVVTGGCNSANSATATVVVNPLPVVTTANTATICSGTGPNISLTASVASTFTWTVGTITGSITGASAGSGATINQVLTDGSNSASGTVQYIVTPTATTGSCPGAPYTITVTVNPTPAVTNASTKTICNNTSTNISLTSSTAATFTWTIGTITGSVTGASAGSGATINQTLTDPSNSVSGTVQYVVTPTATTGSCPGAPYTITVTVNPTPVVTTVNTATICSGTSPNISLTASTPSTFTWTVGTVTGSITGASAGSGATINQTLTNPSNTTAGTVQYLVTPTATTGSCPGASYTITVTVNPLPVVTTANTATICSGTGPNISLTASVASTFTWTVGTITGSITGASAGSGATINQVLTDGSNSASGTVQYIVTPTATTGSCPGAPYTITVTVNPTPAVTNASTKTICNNTSTNISLTSSTAATFTWTIGTITGSVTGASAGSGATINQTLTDPSNSASGTVQYVVTPTATTGSCPGAPYTITVTVNPTPVVTTVNTATICSGTAPSISLTASTSSTFTWTVGTVTGSITGASAGSGATINQVLTDLSNSVSGTVQYLVTPTATTGSCPGAPYTITVTVNPAPAVTTANTATICSGTGPNISLTASVASTFTWTVGTITGSITGASAGSGATINQVLTDGSNSASGTVQYKVTPTATTGSCPGAPYTITVTVNPTPAVTNASTKTICNNTSTAITLTSSTPSSFTWTIGTITGGITGATAGSGANINQVLTNPGATSAGTVQYIVTPTATTGSCPGAPSTITVSVNPTPTATISGSTTVCQGSNAPTVTITNPQTIAITVIYNVNGGTNQSINIASNSNFQGTVSTTNPGTFNINLVSVSYQSAPTCSNSISGTATVVVRPTPTATIAGTDTVCQNDVSPVITITNPQALDETVTYNINGGTAVNINVTANSSATLSVPTNTAGVFKYNLVSVVYQTAPSCSNAITGNATVTVNAIPSGNLVVTENSGTTANDNIICAGDAITFTAPTGYGSYSFYVNGTLVQGPNTDNSYSTTTLLSGQTVTVKIANSSNCGATFTAPAITVNPLPTPTLGVNKTSVCPGDNVIFTAGGGASYNFKVNGSSVQSGVSNTYNTTTLAVGSNSVTVDVTNSGGCIATSSPVTVVVNALPSGTLTATENSGTANDNKICTGSNVTFTATSGFSNYNFKINGVTAPGGNGTSNTYSTTTLTNGQVISVDVTNTSGCTATFGPPQSITVYAIPAGTIAITENSGTPNDSTICPGSSVTFTATSGYSNYSFYLNGTGSPLYSGPSNVYSTSSLANGNFVTAVVSSTNGCTATFTSNKITVVPVPSGNVTASANPVCKNTNVDFTATSGFANYNFKVNGNSVQNGNSNVYSSTGINDGDVITVDVSNSQTCLATFNSVTMSVTPLPAGTLTVAENSGTTANDGKICTGATVVFTAPAGFTNYNFKINGITAPGGYGTSNTYNTSTLNNGDSVSVEVTSTTGCIGPLNSIKITVSTYTTVAAISGASNVCATATITLTDATTSNTNLWSSSDNSIATVNASTGMVTGVAAGTAIISYTVTNANGCSSIATKNITVFASPVVNSISGPSQVCTGSTITLSETTTGGTWNTSDNTIATVNSSGVVTGLTAGNVIISYSVTNSNSCTTAATQNVTVNAVPVVATISPAAPHTVCAGLSIQLSDATTGGTWSSDNTLAATVDNTGKVTGVGGGTANISYAVTTASGCTTTVTTAVTVYDIPVPTLTGPNPICPGAIDTYTTEAGQFSYQWTVTGGTINSGGTSSDNSITITWDQPGTRSIYVNYANANGCTGTTSATLTTSTGTVPTLSGPNVVCLNSTGNMYTTQSGETNYTWTPSAGTITAGGTGTDNTATITWTSSGAQSISVNFTDINGCTPATPTVYPVTVRPLPTATVTGTTAACLGAASPSITFTGANGTVPYTFTYTINGGTPQTVTTAGAASSVTIPVSTASATTYMYNLVSVSGNNGCNQPQTGTATVTVNPLPTATINGTTAVCKGSTAPSVTFTGANGTAPYTFTYTVNGGSNQTVTTTSGNSVTVTQPTGTAGTYTYALVSVAGQYCSQPQTGSAVVKVNALPTATISGTIAVCKGSTAPSVTFTGANGTAPYTFTYTINGGSNQTVTTTSGNSVTVSQPTTTANTYMYALVSVAGQYCSQPQTGSATVTVNPLPTATISGTTAVCQGSAPPSVTFTGSGGTAPYTFTYTINGGSNLMVTTTSGNSVTVTQPTGTAGTYSYALVSVAGQYCSQAQTGSAVINVRALPTATISGTTAVCQGAVSPVVTFTGAGGTAPYTFTYTINGGSNQVVTTTSGNSVTVSQSTTTANAYMYALVSVKDASTTTCSQNQAGSAVVTVNPLPTATIATSAANVCQGTASPTITFTGAGGTAPYTFTYKLNSGSNQTITSTGNTATISVSTASVTTYTYTLVSVTSTAGCSQNQSGSAAVTVSAPPPAPTVMPASATVCQGNIVSFTSGTTPATTNLVLSSGTVNIGIPDYSLTGANSTISVSGIPAGAVINSVSVNFNITHPYDGDLVINLKAPNANILNLVDQEGRGGKNFGNSTTNTTVNSTSTNPFLVGAGNAPYLGIYQPDADNTYGATSVGSPNVSSFSSLTSTPNGNWILSIVDVGPGDVGTLNNWSITINYTSTTLQPVTWSPVTDLYTDAGATNAYTSGTSIATVYVKPSTSGAKTYLATATNANNCTTSTTLSLTVNPSPSVSIAADYCAVPGKVVLTATHTSGSTLLWNTGKTTDTIQVDVAGIYKVTATNSGGCSITATINIANELVTNGNFEAGNVGFTSSYPYRTGAGSLNNPPGYAVDTAANYYGPTFLYGKDHTTTHGKFMMVNGTSGANYQIWQETLNVLPNTTYYFSAWGLELDNLPNDNNGNPPANAQLQFNVNGTQVGTFGNLPRPNNPQKDADNNGWVRFYGTWTSGPTTTNAIVSITDLQGAVYGNNFGLDDISFSTLSTFVNLVSPAGTDAQTVCINTPIQNIVYSAGSSASPPTVTGLPSGVTPLWNGVNLTISGTPTVAGSYSYTVTTTGTCQPASASGTILVNQQKLTVTSGSASQTVCVNTAITNVVYSAKNTDGTAVINVIVKGLPAGVTATAYNTSTKIITISGTPTVAGIFKDSVITTGTCKPDTAYGTVTVQNQTITLSSGSSNQTACINNGITSVIYALGGTATGASVTTGALPAGVTGFVSGTSYIISGTPTAAGTFIATITTSGTCSPGATIKDTITVSANATITLTSAAGSDALITCDSSAITPVTYAIGGSGTGAAITAGALPAGLTGTYSAGIFTISGTPTALGIFNYTITATGTCGSVTKSGSITVQKSTLALTSGNASPTQCLGSTLTNIVFTYSGGATAVTMTGVFPAGVTGALTSGNTYTISGTPTALGTFTYTLTTMGGCSGTTNASVTGTITVNNGTVGGTVTPTIPSICSGGSGILNLTGNTGNVVQWESSVNNGSSWTIITNTTTTLNYTSLTVPTQYRVLVKSGTCSSVYSSVASVNIHNYWTGGTSTDWNTASNWSDNMVPSVSCPDVYIQAGTYQPVLASGTVTITNLHVQAGGNLTVNGTAILQVAGTISNSGIFNVAGGSVELNGTSAQSIAGGTFTGNAINGLIISNTAGVTLTGAVNVFDSLSYNKNGAVLNTNGNLTLKSNAGGTAFVGNMTGHTINGDVTVERYIATGKSYDLLAVPTAGQTIRNSWQEGATSASSNPNPGYGTQLTSNLAGAVAQGFDATSYAPSIKLYDSSANTYFSPASTFQQLYDKRGYLVFVRGDRTVLAGSAAVTTTTLRSKGRLFTPLNAPPVSAVINNTFESIGNPYASQIDMRKIATSGIDPFFYLYDPKLGVGSSYGYGAFQTLAQLHLGGPGDYNYYPTPGGGSYGNANTPYNYIQSGQAFFVHASTGNGTVSFDENDKDNSAPSIVITRQGNGTAVSATPGARGASGASVQSQFSSLRTTLNVVNADGTTRLADGVFNQFGDNFSNGVDAMDAKKVSGNTAENLSIKTSGKLLAIERRHTLTDNDTIFLNLTGERIQNYQFHFDAQNMNTAASGFVIDKYRQTSTPLSLSGATDYNFSIENVAGSYAADRFMIVFSPLRVLPVTFTSIKAYRQDKNIAVEWRVANENNIQEYQAEKSVNGKDFTTLASVKPANNNGGSAVYVQPDTRPVTGDNYYRIRSVDINGAISYTMIVKVTIGEIKQEININPNPITDGQIHLQFMNEPAGKYGLRLLNSLGQIIFQKEITRTEGTSTELLRWDFNLAHGMYKLEVTKPDGSIKIINVLY